MHNIAAVYRSRSVPPSPGMQLPSTPGFGKMEQATSSPITFGRLESNYARRGNFVGDAGSFGAESTGKKHTLLLFCDSILIETSLHKCQSTFKISGEIVFYFLKVTRMGIEQDYFNKLYPS